MGVSKTPVAARRVPLLLAATLLAAHVERSYQLHEFFEGAGAFSD
jgi:hypothetical protein